MHSLVCVFNVNSVMRCIPSPTLRSHHSNSETFRTFTIVAEAQNDKLRKSAKDSGRDLATGRCSSSELVKTSDHSLLTTFYNIRLHFCQLCLYCVIIRDVDNVLIPTRIQMVRLKITNDSRIAMADSRVNLERKSLVFNNIYSYTCINKT